MSWKKARIIRKLIASLLSCVFLLANPLMAQANWQQHQTPNTYLNPNEVNANNPDPLTEAMNKAGTSPFNTDTAGLPNNKPSQPATVDIIQGKLILNSTDLKIPAEGSPVILHRTYNSGSTQVGPFGMGWDYSYNRYLTMYHEYAMLEHAGDQGSLTYNYTKNNPSLKVSSFDGDNRIQYPLDDGYYTAVQSSNTATLTRNQDVTYTVQEKDGTTYKYNRYQKSWAPNQIDGKLSEISDSNGNSITFQYDKQGHLIQITDMGGRSTSLSYSGNLISAVTDPLERTTSFEYDGNNRLIKVTDPAGSLVSYSYDLNNQLTSVIDAVGKSYNYTYDSGKLKTVTNPSGTIIETYDYNPADKKTTVTRLGNRVTNYDYDSDNNILQITDPLGKTTKSTWDSKRNQTQSNV